MKELSLTEAIDLRNSNEVIAIIFGDSASILTTTLKNLFSDVDGFYYLDTETELNSYSKFRIRNIPTIQIWKSGILIDKFDLPITKNKIIECLESQK